jgi:hypothetical protein
MWTSMISIAMWVLSLIFSLFGTTSTLALETSPPVRPAAVVQPQAIGTTVNAAEQRPGTPSIRYQVLP